MNETMLDLLIERIAEAFFASDRSEHECNVFACMEARAMVAFTRFMIAAEHGRESRGDFRR